MSVINTNVAATIASNALVRNERDMSTAMERLSTGLRINSAKDDAAGLSIASRMTSQITGMNQAIRNANDGASMMQTAEGAMVEVTNMLQRMRELSVQSATSTNSDSDRATMNLEVQQLKAEIDTIAANTSFNGKTLLNGTFGSQNLQVGYQANQSMSVNMTNVSTTAMGDGVATALAASGDKAATDSDLETARDLNTGDLVINGVAVGATLNDDDGLSMDAKSGSAIAVVAAINKVSAETGVTATVGSTIFEGESMTAAPLTGEVTINGVETASVTTLADAGASRALITDAINLLSDQTGVRAVDTGSDKGGVQLIADDGRNITVAFTTLTAAATGVGTAGVQSGSYSLQSTNGGSINISSTQQDTTKLAKTGLAAGSFDSNVATLTSTARSAAISAAAPSSSTTGVLEAGDLAINGVGIAAAITTDDTASNTVATSSTKAASAIAIAAAINKSSADTGVTATANANVIVGATTYSAAANNKLLINGIDVGATTVDDTRQDVADTINAFTGQTGVVAEDNGVGLTLTAADGRNISVASENGLAAILGFSTDQMDTGATSAADSATTYGTVSLSSDVGFTIDRSSNANTNLNALGFTAGTFGGGSGGQIANIAVDTAAGANSALTAIDAALESVSNARAEMGAASNRLDYTVDNLSNMVSNTEASRSRIQDADYAKETTELARAQIIAQAGTAMLAQANQVKQTVLSLLQ